MMLWTVLRRADQPSLWKHTMTLVLGSSVTGRFLPGSRHQASLWSGRDL